MGHGESESVGGVVPRHFVQGKQGANHQSYLLLARLTPTRHRALHVGRSVLCHFDPRSRECSQNDPARVTELCSGLSILVEKERLHGANVGLVSRHELGELRVDYDQSGSQRCLGIEVDDAMRQVRNPVALASDEPPAQMSSPWIDTKSQHTSVSISARGMRERFPSCRRG